MPAHAPAPPLPASPPRPAPTRPAAPPPGTLPLDQGARVTEFARACRAAARAVSLYPGEHPAVALTVTRLRHRADRLGETGAVTLAIHPRMLLLDGCAPARPDPAIGELAHLLHERLIGALGFHAGIAVDDWHALLRLLAQSPDDLRAAGGITRIWTASGRNGFAIHEIDYADVLRERGGVEAAWERVIARCLQGDTSMVDDAARTALLEALQDVSRFAGLLQRLQQAADAAGATLSARTAALMRLLTAAVDAARAGEDASVTRALQTMAEASAQLTPEMLLALLDERRAAGGEATWLAGQIIDRLGDDTVAAFVAHSIESAHGASERLALAFQTLVPERDRKERLLDLAYDRATAGGLGATAGFETLWRDASQMLLSYSDAPFVSPDYARELTAARTHAVDVERVSDDPPDRIGGWLQSISDDAVRELDRCLLLDLLHMKDDPAAWEGLATLAATEAQRRLLLGEFVAAQDLLAPVALERTAGGRPGLAAAADAVLAQLASGPFARHVVLQLRKGDDDSLPPIRDLCLLVGPTLIRPLAETLATEDHARTVRRLRELLLAFGTAGRDSVEQLKGSTNPAVRRAAIDLLRVFGGHGALAELVSMVHDADPQVQRESVRAIVQIGTAEAHRVLEEALLDSAVSRQTLVQQLIGLRDPKAIPLLCGVLLQTRPRGPFAALHRDVIDALGGIGGDPGSLAALRAVLHGGRWWAPWRTASLRQAAATALRRIGSPEARALLQEAAASSRWGVRRAAEPEVRRMTNGGEAWV